MIERGYLRIMERLIHEGSVRPGRNGTTYSLFGGQLRHNLRDGFPLLTTKRVHFQSVVTELLWFMRGDTNVRWLQEHGCTIWDEWADENGDLGPVYGAQWAKQLPGVIDALRADPYSRRHVVNCWQLDDLPSMALPPCHMSFQFHVSDERLSCHMYQRSADWFLGVPFNIASYALLTHLVAREVGLGVGELIISFGDMHLYANHIEAALTQLDREPRAFPQIHIDNPVTYDGVWFTGYDPHPVIKAEVSK